MLLFQRINAVDLYFLTLLLSSLSIASSLDTVCNSVKQLGECKARINVPDLALKHCNQDFFKVDPCKTKLSGRYPCGVSWRGVKWCDGWTCVPGTVKTVIRVPCGVNVKSKALDLCAMARGTIPAIGELTRQAAGYCECLPKVLDFVDLDTVKSLVTSLDIGDAAADLLQKYGDAQVCMIDNGFNIQDNKNGLSASGGALFHSENVKVFTAAEIDLSRYIALAGALATCVTGCNEPAIQGFFTDYLTDSEEAMSKQLQEFLKPWQASFSGIETQFSKLDTSMSQIQAQFGTITTSVGKITDDFCANITSCVDTSVTKLKAKVEDTVKSSQAIIGLQKELATAVADTKELNKIVSDAITAFDTLADLGIDTIFAKVVQGKIRSIKEIAETLQAAKRLPVIINQMQRILPNVQKYTKQLQDLAPDFTQNMEAIIGESWFSKPSSDRATAQATENAIRQIQSLVKDNLMPQVTGVIGSVASVANLLQAVSVGGIPTIEVRVASYQRWSTGHFSMPCLTTGKIKLKLGVYEQTVDYPKFYRCEQAYQIPFPNHHIPYVKVSFPTQRSVGIKALTIGDGDSLSSENETVAAPVAVGVDALTTSFTVEIPTMTQAIWASISTPDPDAVSMEPTGTPDLIDPEATAINLSAEATAFTTPADVYTKSEDIPAASFTSFDPSIVFFSTVNEAGTMVTNLATLSGAEVFEVTSTAVIETVTGALGEDVEPSSTQQIVTSVVTTSSAVGTTTSSQQPGSALASPSSSATRAVVTTSTSVSTSASVVSSALVTTSASRLPVTSQPPPSSTATTTRSTATTTQAPVASQSPSPSVVTNAQGDATRLKQSLWSICGLLLTMGWLI